MHKDSPLRTIIVAFLLCLICSILVTSSAIVFKSRQEKNRQLDIKKNLLIASGLLTSSKPTEKEILETYKSVTAEIINLDTGEIAKDILPEDFDQKKFSRDKKHNKVIEPSEDYAGIKRRSKYSTVYKIMKDGVLSMIILPVNGKGLWSTLYGFIAISKDTRIIKGIGFYEHAETPGLGGEIENPSWKKQWEGKTLLDEDYQPIFKVAKGRVDLKHPDYRSQVDGLSGATITSNGVSGLIRYWLGKDGFGPFLAKLRQSQKNRIK